MLVNYASIQRKVNHGLGIAGKHVGQPYASYRVGPTTSGDFPGDWILLDPDVLIYWLRRVEGKLLTGMPRATIFEDVYFNLDRIPTKVGDCFLCVDPPLNPGVSYGPGATSVEGTKELYGFALAQQLPAAGSFTTGPNTGAWLNHLARIYRPASVPTLLPDGAQYWKSTHEADDALVLTNGLFSFQPYYQGFVASVIPIGLATAFRPSGPLPFGPPPPGMIRPSHWFIYIPPLHGYTPREGDAIITFDDQRFVVVDTYAQETGIAGNQLMCDRTISQPG